MFIHEKVDLGYEDLGTIEKNGKRVYINEHGEEYPSVTSVLSILSEKFIAIWRAKIGEEEANKISTRASRRGTAVHAIIEKYLDNDENYKEGYTPDVLESFLNIKGVLDENIGRIYAQESPLYSDHLRLAGRVDCVAEFNGKLSIIDFKTSKKRKYRSNITNYFQQEAAYAIMWEERTGMPVSQLVTIIAVDGGESQVFVEQRDLWTKPLKETIELYRQRNASAI